MGGVIIVADPAMNFRTLVALALTFTLSPHSAAAQEFFSETVEVRVTNVEAIVTDRGGKPVAGLTQNDFEVYEDGVRQEITNFSEIREQTLSSTSQAAAPKDTRRRVIVVFVDNATLEMGTRNAVLPELRRFLRDNVRAGDSVALMSWGNSLAIDLEPTSDHAAIAAAVDKLALRTVDASGDWRAQMENEINDLIRQAAGRQPPEPPDFMSARMIASAYSSRLSSEMRRKAAALESVIASMRGMDGRKVLVLLTQSLSANPAEEAWHFLDSIREVFGRNAQLNPISDASPYALQGVETKIAAAANSSGITLYPIHATGKMTGSSFRDATKGGRTGMNMTAAADTTTPAVHAIAQETGGVAMTGSTNFALAFDTISNDLRVYYSIGYRTSGERQDRMKNVEVRVKNKRLAVRTRKAVIEQTPASEMTDAVAANLFSMRDENDLGITATADGATMVITIPTATLTLAPEGNDLTGKLSAFCAFLRKDGAVSRVDRQTHQFRFPAASLARRKEVTIRLELDADESTGTMSLGVMDENSRATGFAVVKLE
jgi:VWFA-related protein